MHAKIISCCVLFLLFYAVEALKGDDNVLKEHDWLNFREFSNLTRNERKERSVDRATFMEIYEFLNDRKISKVCHMESKHENTREILECVMFVSLSITVIYVLCSMGTKYDDGFYNDGV